MSRQDLIAAFGKPEGTRLFSQITVSRNMQGYTTSKGSELRKVLERHRSKIEKNRSSGEEENSDEGEDGDGEEGGQEEEEEEHKYQEEEDNKENSQNN